MGSRLPGAGRDVRDRLGGRRSVGAARLFPRLSRSAARPAG
jgi:hypothetical protein